MGLMDPDYFEFRIIDWNELQWGADRGDKSEGRVVHPDVLEFEKAYVRRMRELQVPTYCNEMLRSLERCNALRVEGFHMLTDGIDPYVQGYACSIMHCLRKEHVIGRELDFMVQIGQEIAQRMALPMVWGGPENPYDMYRWEHAEWADIKKDMEAH